jgi:hypothetical protein
VPPLVCVLGSSPLLGTFLEGTAFSRMIVASAWQLFFLTVGCFYMFRKTHLHLTASRSHRTLLPAPGSQRKLPASSDKQSHVLRHTQTVPTNANSFALIRKRLEPVAATPLLPPSGVYMITRYIVRLYGTCMIMKPNNIISQNVSLQHNQHNQRHVTVHIQTLLS